MLTSLAALAALQHPDGCFPSTVVGRHATRADRNGFTTALVVRALRDAPGAEPIRSAALEYVATCAAPCPPGAFGFWPQRARPGWAPHLPPDADDTAIMTIELLRAGRISRREALRTAASVLLRHRLAESRSIRPPWVVPGAFLTWLASPDPPNLVDCCVNANVVALLALLDATDLPGYGAAVATVSAAVAWAGERPARHRAITPFYPTIAGLHESVEHAVECGAAELAPTLAALRQIDEGPAPGPDTGWCCSAYSATVWRCAALAAARAFRTSVTTRSPTCFSPGTPTSPAPSSRARSASTTPTAAVPSS